MPDPITSLHYAANGNFVNGQYAPGADGFNLADISSASQLSELPAGVKGLVYLGMTGGVTAAFQSTVSSFIGSSQVYGFYLADEPNPSATTAANLKAESDWIHAHDPGVKTFIVEENSSSNTTPQYYYTPANTDVDLFGLDPYPVQTNVPNNYDLNIIPLAVQEAQWIGIPQQDLVPVYQAFGGGAYSTYFQPSATQEQQILSTWGAALPHPAFDYAYSWGVQSGDIALSNSSALQQIFAAHNGAAGASAAPTIGDSAVQSGYVDAANDTAAQALSGSAAAGDTVKIYLNGSTTPKYTTVANASGQWSVTIGALANWTYSFAATATNAAGATSASTAALSFTVDTIAPAAPTISDSAVAGGYVNAARDTATEALLGTAAAGCTVKVYLNGSTTPKYTALANVSGQWSVTVGALANGAYSYTTTATDAAGNTGVSSAALKFTVDTIAPAVPTIADSAVQNGVVGQANDTAAQALAGTAEAASTVKVYLNQSTTPTYSTVAGTSGQWTVTVGALAAGVYSYAATTTDAAGNSSPFSAALSFTVGAPTNSGGPSTALHYAANGNFVNGQYAPGADGFNLADISSASQLSELPAGVKGLVYLGMTGGVTAAFQSTVSSFIGSSQVYGFYLADEPNPSATTAANLKAESDWIHAHDPGVKTFIVEENSSSNTTPQYYYTPANTDVDLFGLDPYPVQTNVPNNYDLNIIPLAVQEANRSAFRSKTWFPFIRPSAAGPIPPTSSPAPHKSSSPLNMGSSPAAPRLRLRL